MSAGRPARSGGTTSAPDAACVYEAEDGRLLLGDNLQLVTECVADGAVDLVYMDPPFNSDARYRVERGRDADPSRLAFEDLWRWDDAAESELQSITGDPGELLRGLRPVLGRSNLLAYLVHMTPRLVALRRTLAPAGSMYLHCDGSASHYLKIVMDAVFGAECFLNHVVWLYGLGGSSSRYWPRKHDDLLWYARVRGRHHFEAAMIPARSARMRGQHKKAPDWWDIPALNNMAGERVGYPTQKPLALLERIVASSSPPGGLVLDPCCGSGTALVAARRLGRRWIGIDRAAVAVETTLRRLQDSPRRHGGHGG